MKLYCAKKLPDKSSREIRHERDDYINEYNTRKERYLGQINDYNSAYKEYEDRIVDELKSILSNELAQLPGVTISITDAYDLTGTDGLGGYHPRSDLLSDETGFNFVHYAATYKIRIAYRHANFAQPDRYKINRKIGFSWSFDITLKPETATFTYPPENSTIGEYVLYKNPVITVEQLDTSEYGLLKATYDLFTKIDTIDWESLLNRVKEEIPKAPDYVTEPAPGTLNLNELNNAFSKARISEFMGKDLWIRCEYKVRYDSYKEDYFLRFIRMKSPKICICDSYRIGWGFDGALPIRYNHNNLWRSNVVWAQNKEFRINGLKLVEPLEVYETDELFLDEADEQ